MFVFALSLQQWSEVGNVVTGLGVVFVLAQVWQAQRNGRVELITGMTTLFVEIDRVFVEHPGLQKYFGLLGDCEAQPEPNTEEAEQAHAIATMMANALDHVVEHLCFMKCDTRRAWKKYITEVHEKSTVFKNLLEAHPDWWPGLQEQVR